MTYKLKDHVTDEMLVMATKGDDRMKCSHCGEEIKDVTVHRFTHDGAAFSVCSFSSFSPVSRS